MNEKDSAYDANIELRKYVTLKRPRTATSLAEANSLASSTVEMALAAGPVFFSSQLTISSAVRPPEQNKTYNVSCFLVLGFAYRCSLKPFHHGRI